MLRLLQLLVCLWLIGLWACAKEEEAPPSVAELPASLKALKIEHPRLMLTDERLNELKQGRKTDATLDKYINAVIASANAMVNKAELKRELIGPRLLSVSRELLSRTTHLALAYRFTGDTKYLNAALSNMRTVCEFSDWNPSHFLDVAEMLNGVAIGYDWLYNDMSTSDKVYFRERIKTKGLAEYRKVYETAWWHRGDNNWNQVCNGGLLVGALSIAETDPTYAAEYLPKVIENLPFSNKFYAPDGAWYEGPGYWAYATEYLSYGMSALQTAMGNLYNLDKTEGLSKSGLVPMICAGPTNYILNFADSGENSKATTSAAMLFLSTLYNNPQIANYLHSYLKSSNALATPFHVVWYKAPTAEAAAPPLDYYLRGEINELVFLRSSWTDPNASWIGFKSGVNSSNHSHLDVGNFELDAGGMRWAKDLGSDDYDLDGYWDMGVNGKRWSYYRLNSFSHNVPLLGNKNQYELAKASFISTDLNTATPSASLDLTQAYRDFSTKSIRKVSLVDNRKNFLIEDSHTLSKTTEVAWGMTTANSIELVKGGKAILRNATVTSRTLEAEIIEPKGVEFTIESAVQKAPEKLNTGHSRLMLRLPNQSGRVTIMVKLSPKG
ncbi:MAG: heparinase II/III family protein [Spirosomataceae bacterium]